MGARLLGEFESNWRGVMCNLKVVDAGFVIHPHPLTLKIEPITVAFLQDWCFSGQALP
jgi:hypothetical protein